MEIRDSCGVFGGYGCDPIAPEIVKGLFGLQHRGQESVGTVTSDGKQFYERLRQGLVSPNFNEEKTVKLKGHFGIGHVRYSTAGGASVKNTQPLVVEIKGKKLYFAHNGNLDNYEELKNKMESEGSIFSTTTDTELFPHLIAKSNKETLEDKIADACTHVSGAYSLLIMTEDKIIGLKDPHGFKPLEIGKRKSENGEYVYFLASETTAFSGINVKYVRSVDPGEMIVFDEKTIKTPQGYKSLRITKEEIQPSFCVFELIYFMKPDSLLNQERRSVAGVRKKNGRTLAKEHYVDADVVIPIPDSGNHGALGYSIESGIPYDYGFVRNHYVGRTFIMPYQQDRTDGTDMKLMVVPEVVYGKRVVVVDDSLVRGTTIQKRVKKLKEAGAKEVHVRVCCPPNKNPCFHGIDFPTKKELAINKYGSVEGVRKFIGADSLEYLSINGLLSDYKTLGNSFCAACFDGNYKTDFAKIRFNKSTK